VQLRTTADHVPHARALENHEIVGVTLQPLEELRVADQRHLYRLRHARDLVPWRQRVEQIEAVHHRARRSKRTDEVLLVVQVDPVLHPGAGVVLRQNRRRYPDVTDPTVRGGRHQSDGIEHGTATETNYERVTIEVMVEQHSLHLFDEMEFDLHPFA